MGDQLFIVQCLTHQFHNANQIHDIAMGQLGIVDVGMQANSGGQGLVTTAGRALVMSQRIHQGLYGETGIERMNAAGVRRIMRIDRCTRATG